MNFRKCVLILALVFFSGCAHYQTANDSTDANLRPRILKGPLHEIQLVAYEAAKKAFPDETKNISIKGTNQVIILREWFWRGDTMISISIEKSKEDNCIINAESKASHHRLNAALISSDAAKNEIAHYFIYLDQEYELYFDNKKAVSTSQSKH